MKTSIRFSQFVSLLRKGSKCYLYSSLNGGLVRIEDIIANRIYKEEDNLFYSYDEEDDFIVYMRNNKFIGSEEEDSKAINIMKYKRLKSSFQSDRLSLVIAPTLYCNFKCPYCYEKDLPNSRMSDMIQDRLIEFIAEKQKACKELEICWHGGEPTMALSSIERLLLLIREKINMPLVQHAMVTNGYAINDTFISLFKIFPLNSIQITIDGDRTTHNQNRICKSGVETYDKIIGNVDRLSIEIPDTLLKIRMNVHKNNADQFFTFYEVLKNRWKGRNVYLYPAFVSENENCSVPCFNSIEKTKFLLDIYRTLGVKYKEADLSLNGGLCTAHYKNSLVVDPDGLLYKCWVDIGKKERSIGDLDKGITNLELFCQYILGTDKFADKKCQKCSLLPVCDGGCSRYRFGDEYQTSDQCPFSEAEIINFMV